MNKVLGILYSNLANLIFAIMIGINTFTKDKVNAVESNFIQFLFALLTSIPYIIYKYGFINKDESVLKNTINFLKSDRYYILILRALTGCLYWLFVFLSSKFGIDNKILTLLTLSSTIFLPIISIITYKIPFLHEYTLSKDDPNYNIFVWISIIIGLIGSFIFLYSNKNKLNLSVLGVIFGLLAGLMFALAQLSVRWAENTENNDRILFYFFLIPSIIYGLVYFLTSKKYYIKMNHLIIIAITGIILFVAEIFLNTAFHYTDPSIISSSNNTILIYSMIIGYLFLNNKITKHQMIGSIIILLSGFLPLVK